MPEPMKLPVFAVPVAPPSENSRRVEDIFIAALELIDPAQRAVYLAEACGEDAALRAEVEELLRAGESRGFLNGPAVYGGPLPEREGECIGRYKLLQEIGEGGFGTVWMAEQLEPVTRRVALKIIKLGMDTREVIARFEAERQALAMMDHPNIARVLDAGATAQGRPFFVMELVKGMPITQYCDEAGLGTRARLRLFADVCSAISHAHQKGVIHRDIKPSNVMVTLYADQPVVKVIDFGIAKATQGRLTDKTLFTRFEQFIGTPVYMSPEQTALSAVDIDTRSDIYGLGVLLYELLTGKPPFDPRTLASAGYEEMRRIIREVEPPRPSSRLSTIAGEERTTIARARHIEPERLGRLVEPDLDWIVMKAIEKDRARRYDTANSLALDIQRFLADEPVSATPPSASYQFRKFARRHRLALRVGAVMAAVLIVATAVSTWQAVRARQAERKIADTLKQMEAERDGKEKARRDAEDIAKFLGEVFRSPNPAQDGREIKVVELLDRAAKRLETDMTSQPARRAKLQATLAKTYWALGLYRQAIPLQEQVRAYSLAAWGLESQETLWSMTILAMYYREAGRRDEALALQEQVLPLSRKVLGPEHSDTLAAMNNLANSYFNAGRTAEALRMREEVLALRRKVNGPENPDTFIAMANVAQSYDDAGRAAEALALREEVLTLRRKVLGAEHPETLLAMTSLAISAFKASRAEEALRLREEVLALRRKVSGPEHPETLRALQHLIFSYDVAGRADEARGLREQLLVLQRRLLGPNHQNTLATMTELAQAWRDKGDPARAEVIERDMAAMKRKAAASPPLPVIK